LSDKLRIAAIGDSLMQGFQHGAIYNTAWAYPAIVARALGLNVPFDFSVATIPPPGYPLNIEDFLREAQQEFGETLSTLDWLIRFPNLLHRYTTGVSNYYEHGGGSQPSNYAGDYLNQAVWGFTVLEGTALTSTICDGVINAATDWIEDEVVGVPSASMYRTARRVLNPPADPLRNRETQVDNLARLTATAPLDVLLVGLGANDALATVLTLEVKDMATATGTVPADPIKRLAWNLTSADQFRADYVYLAERILHALGDRSRTQVFLATVPHVTIPPITAGVGDRQGKYFEYYGRYFVDNNSFDRLIDKHLTRDEAVLIDARIDQFNDTIRSVAEAHSWHIVDLCEVLDALAVKRNNLTATPEDALRKYYADLGITDHPLLRLSPIPNVLMLQLDQSGSRIAGGLFGLDGVHPTTIGYGLVAEAFLRVMQRAGVPGADPSQVPWTDVLLNDTLLQLPPAIWRDICSTAKQHATLWDLIFRAIS
jgi:lysophospholipase L1-like esterase